MTIRNLALLLCLGVFLAACAGPADPPRPPNPMGLSNKHDPQAEKWYAMAHVLWKDETCSDPQLAIEYLDKSLAIEPDYVQALIRRGLAYSQQRQWDKAFADVTRAVRLAPSAETYTWRGLVMLRMGNALGAVRDTTRALEYQKDYSWAWNIRAAAKLTQKDIPGACIDFKSACSAGDCSKLTLVRQSGICPE